MSTALELGGIFYPEFTNAKNYGADLRACIERTVRRLLSTTTRRVKIEP